ncbi:hypothetical protein NECAME_08253 [Necator americanus]|uniref:Uncharacterized protein n=1 Tax=Necator americanus TaxID=51031 RepID=W2TK42_NECAM|nr:hypothetical protein NECAME_08253 [Necator americanus]ETN81994.1 hypothetical protein NECAME_08253 [Necator americanus]
MLETLNEERHIAQHNLHQIHPSLALYILESEASSSIRYYTYDTDEYGFAFWLAVSALILAGVDVAVASVTVCLGERGL